MATPWALATVALATAVSVSSSNSQSCQTLGTAKKAEIEAYLKRLYKLPDNQTIPEIDTSFIDSACYRKVAFRPRAGAPLLTVYLAPDGEHLAIGLIDLTVDPFVAQRKMREELAQKLASDPGSLRARPTPLAKWSCSPISNAPTASGSQIWSTSSLRKNAPASKLSIANSR
jgi:hypothetical protein